MMKKGGLGKGFDSLLPQNFDNSILVDETERIQREVINLIQDIETLQAHGAR